jgi:hypothetical protein
VSLIWRKNKSRDQWVAGGEDTRGYYVITAVDDGPAFPRWYELEANGRILNEEFVDFETAKQTAADIEERRT